MKTYTLYYIADDDIEYGIEILKADSYKDAVNKAIEELANYGVRVTPEDFSDDFEVASYISDEEYNYYFNNNN